jgi:oxygen-independent coproporphyrinogen-3 oxidase
LTCIKAKSQQFDEIGRCGIPHPVVSFRSGKTFWRMSEAVKINAEQAVPRYTSYPTAPHFTAAVNADTYGAWLQALPREASLSLYLHVPYCRQLCLYCGCHTKAVRRDAPIEAYAQTLEAEVRLIGALAPRRGVVHLHWGGGTPSILGGERLARLVETLADTFDLSALREHAIELDPRHLTRALARTLKDIGINRASFGVQDFTPKVQQAIGRVQPFQAVEQAVAMLRDVGIERINLDLMYGLPYQTAVDVRRTAAQAHSLRPQRIAVFGYAHVPWFRPQQRLFEPAALPQTRERIAQAESAHSTLLELGYAPIGLDHYAQPDDDLAQAARSGRLHRNFQGYTTDEAEALLGIGASSIGRLPQGFVQNAPDNAGYARAIAAGRLPTVRGIAVSPDDRMRGRIIERLMCDLEVDLEAVARTDGDAETMRFADELEALRPLAQEGLVRLEGTRLRVTEAGRSYVRLVASAFDAYLPRGKARHSIAV